MSMEGTGSGFANGQHQYDNNQQFNHAYDSLFPTGGDQSLHDASWGVNASGYPDLSQSHIHNGTVNQRQQQATQSAQHSSYQPAPISQQGASQAWAQTVSHIAPKPAQQQHQFAFQASPYARSVSNSPAPFTHNAFSNSVNGIPNGQNPQYRQPQYDPSLFGTSSDVPGYQPRNEPTIAPRALENGVQPREQPRQPLPEANTYRPAANPTSVHSMSQMVDQQALLSMVPRGVEGGIFSVIDFGQLSKATTSVQMGPYLNVGRQASEWPVTRTAAMPQYVARRSRNDLRVLAAKDPALLDKIGRKSLKHRMGAPADAHAIAKAKAQAIVKAAGNPSGIKFEGDSSSSEDESDDDDSSYTSDEDLEDSPLPAKRPDTPKGAVEYDTIKAVWRSKRKVVDSASIRQGLSDFWEIVRTIRDRWKSDGTAVAEATEKNKTSDLPLLQSRVKDQRDMMDLALKTALKHGHRSIIEFFGENAPLMYLCYQFLLDRLKAEDANGALTRAILEFLGQCTTLTEDTLEKTHIAKVLARLVKKADAKTHFSIKRLRTNAAAASKKQAAESPKPKAIGADQASTAAGPVKPTAQTEPVAGVKRASSSVTDGGAQKKAAVGSEKPTAIVKKVGTTNAASKAVAPAASSSASTSTAPKAKPVPAKTSTFFSALQSASKKPGTSIKSGTPAAAAGVKGVEKKAVGAASAAAAGAPKSTFSFAETMANLAKPKEEKVVTPQTEKAGPVETEEEKAKRVRKEARRKLHVSFKLGDELTEIRYFTHDPDEELGHDHSQVRDMHDVGGEGRMLKRHADDVDDEDEAAEEEIKLVDFRQPSMIDFGDVDEESRNSNYAPYGGGEKQPDSPERTAREQYDAATLMVFYNGEQDIPPNPREPADPYSGPSTDVVRQFDTSSLEKYAARAAQRRPKTFQPSFGNQAASAAPRLDLAALGNFMSSQQSAPPQFSAAPAQPAAPTLNPDIEKILQSLQQSVLQPQAPVQAPHPPVPQPPAYLGYPPYQPSTLPQQIDLAAIMAQITGQQQRQTQQQPPASYAMEDVVMENGADGRDAKRWRDQGGEKNRFFKTKVCKYWQEGKCLKGDACTYLHE